MSFSPPLTIVPLRLRAALPSCLSKPVIYYVEHNKSTGDIAPFDLLIHIKGLALILYLENAIVCNIRL